MSKLTVAEASRRGYGTGLSILQAVQKNWLRAEKRADGQWLVDAGDLVALFGPPVSPTRSPTQAAPADVPASPPDDMADVASHAGQAADAAGPADDDADDPEPDEGWGKQPPADSAPSADVAADIASLHARIAELQSALSAERRRTAALLDVLANRVLPAAEPQPEHDDRPSRPAGEPPAEAIAAAIATGIVTPERIADDDPAGDAVSSDVPGDTDDRRSFDAVSPKEPGASSERGTCDTVSPDNALDDMPGVTDVRGSFDAVSRDDAPGDAPGEADVRGSFDAVSQDDASGDAPGETDEARSVGDVGPVESGESDDRESLDASVPDDASDAASGETDQSRTFGVASTDGADVTLPPHDAEVGVPPWPADRGADGDPPLAADIRDRALPRTLKATAPRPASPFVWQLWALVAFVWIGLIGAVFWYVADLGPDLWVLAQWLRGERAADTPEFLDAAAHVQRAVRDIFGPPAALFVLIAVVRAAAHALRR